MGQLKDHLISHTGNKPFQCPYCKKNYRRKEILKKHIMIHSRETFFLKNKEKFQEMINEVNRMKYRNNNYNKNYKNNDKCSNLDNFNFRFSSQIVEEDFQLNKLKSTNIESFSSLEEKGKNFEDENENIKIEKKNKNNCINFIEKNSLDKINANIFSDSTYFDNIHKIKNLPNDLDNELSSKTINFKGRINFIDLQNCKNNNNFNEKNIDFNKEKKNDFFLIDFNENFDLFNNSLIKENSKEDLNTNSLFFSFYEKNKNIEDLI